MKTPLRIVAILLLSARAWGEEPALPMGLGAEEPQLPTGLEEPAKASANEPDLPLGLELAEPESNGKDQGTEAGLTAFPLQMSGFAETRLGARLQDDPTQKRASIGEARAQWQAEAFLESVTFKSVADFLYDPVLDHHRIDLERGEGWLDLREANFMVRPVDAMDIKLGRQILTWGTGDLLFINDLFPKDWNALMIGRDEEYLKAPSDAAKISLFSDVVNLDWVYTPQFDADRYIDGERISYYSAGSGEVVGRNEPVRVEGRQNALQDDELALRAYRLLGPYELAAYYYRGFWKSPAGVNPGSGLYTFPELQVWGASVRGPVAGGVASAELGYYDSLEDDRGDDPWVRNSEWRALIGYERELLPELTGAVQFYIESMQDYDAFKASQPPSAYIKDEHRQVVTLRLTRLLMNQNLTLSLFNFWSPNEEDGYLRLKANYKVDDHWRVESGANVFYGEREETFFGQLKDNSNLYVALRYGF
ncbi:hypothetical protein EUZ85_08575 [Hahella sp. KA22]|uniref:DUF1302 family protein n=1 Tax=Hahella sp. KA22 TaxID=1628392 RepID=UPI000FDEB239|nr:DUF1302 family protein [Hahella sp. KA22]AZZ90765.1 hypothetical protein ENC22_06020 [Hahella sp. KA22]QAY54136.1 hypothetical protein EUZ85_08575 [Hahella sp. KA22]